jgi:hypothetical protein
MFRMTGSLVGARYSIVLYTWSGLSGLWGPSLLCDVGWGFHQG